VGMAAGTGGALVGASAAVWAGRLSGTGLKLGKRRLKSERAIIRAS